MPNWTELLLDLSPVLGNWSSGAGPIYGRLARALKAAIERGDLPAGSRLPP
jgi:DNA-binding GntR family transcriptional regulator